MVSSGTPVAPGRTHHFDQDFAVGTSLSSVQSVLPFLASGWDRWPLHGMDSRLCNTPAHSWLVLCPDQHFCHSPGTIMWLRNAQDSPDYMILEEERGYQLEQGRECSCNLILRSATNNLTKRCNPRIVSTWWKRVKDLLSVCTDIKRWIFILRRHGIHER